MTPNSDTPYSYLWMDLRAEPVIVTVPKIEPNRYYTGQLVDLYTYNFAYLGTRAFGNDGGTFLCECHILRRTWWRIDYSRNGL